VRIERDTHRKRRGRDPNDLDGDHGHSFRNHRAARLGRCHHHLRGHRRLFRTEQRLHGQQLVRSGNLVEQQLVRSNKLVEHRLVRPGDYVEQQLVRSGNLVEQQLVRSSNLFEQ
jgi:hypothetical protein